MALTSQEKAVLKAQCGELKVLPNGWSFDIAGDNQIYYFDATTRKSTLSHPTYGPLPPDWRLIVEKKADKSKKSSLKTYYTNVKSLAKSYDDPRNLKEVLLSQKRQAPTKELEAAANKIKALPSMDWSRYERGKIDEKTNFRDKYQIIHTIDDGQGAIGGMNGGVYVVEMKGVRGRIFIEKRFKADMVSYARGEIEMMQKLKHPALTMYAAAFILEHANPPQASLYMEYCDRGSLGDMIKVYGQRRLKGDTKAIVPEGFVWHALAGLADALSYLQYGLSTLKKPDSRPEAGWIPIVHRDIKPDNIFIRSRSTINTTKYFYVVLSDFGLACEDRPPGDPKADAHQEKGYQLGTPTWIAPELCHDPYPRSSDDQRYYPRGQKHSNRSDLWAVGASIYNLCEFDGNDRGLSHFGDYHGYRKAGIEHQAWVVGTQSRKRDLKISCSQMGYSSKLRDAILKATEWDPKKRPDPVKFVKYLVPLLAAAGLTKQAAYSCAPLPDWATRVHDYHSKAESKRASR